MTTENTDGATGLTMDELAEQVAEGDTICIQGNDGLDEDLWTVAAVVEEWGMSEIELVEPKRPIVDETFVDNNTVTIADESVEHCGDLHPMYEKHDMEEVPCKRHAGHAGEHIGNDHNSTVTWDDEESR
jgi:hypothetical protein